ncbi:MAG: hypothetical protein E7106_00380 [Prevotella sp.]|nr:hypothetical protein [Prevotella sp.]
MKKISFFHSALAALALTVAFTSCSKDDENNDSTPPTPVTPYHYDLTVSVGNHGGMGQDKQGHLTMSVASLSNPQTTITFVGSGSEITDYTMEAIYKGKYLYQVPVSADRFSKLQFKNNKMQVIQEQKFKENTYSSRNYTHAWINDNTLVIMASNGDNNKIIWTKLNTDDMSILAEGELAIPEKSGYTVLTTSGLLAYRKSDNKLFYFYYWKTKKRNGVVEPNFHIAVVNPATMALEEDIVNSEGEQMQGSAYGELLQNTIFFDENDNLYLSAFNDVDGKNIGRLLRIKKGEKNFEAGYNAFPEAKGKLVSVMYLKDGKVLAYSGDAAAGTSIGSVAYYYSIIDVNTKKVTRLAYNGTEIPYSSGSFSQRAVYNSYENKGYFGVNTADEQAIYIYDVATGAVTKGASLAAGYYFEQIRIVED